MHETLTAELLMKKTDKYETLTNGSKIDSASNYYASCHHIYIVQHTNVGITAV